MVPNVLKKKDMDKKASSGWNRHVHEYNIYTKYDFYLIWKKSRCIYSGMRI